MKMRIGVVIMACTLLCMACGSDDDNSKPQSPSTTVDQQQSVVETTVQP